EGVELLDNLSGFINELGSVSWTNMTGLIRANYQWQMAGDTCTVRPLSRKIMVRLPEEASSLIIEDPSRSGWGSWQVSGGNGSVLNVRAGESFALGEKFKRSIEIETAAVSP